MSNKPTPELGNGSAPVFGVATGKYDGDRPCDSEPCDEAEPIVAVELAPGRSIAFEDGLQARRCTDGWWPSRPRLPL